MIIRDLNLRRAALRPTKADPVLSVDPNTVLTLSVLGEGLQMVSGWNPEFLESTDGVQLIKLPEGDLPETLGTTPACLLRAPSIEDIFSPLVTERLDHDSMIARISCYFKSKRKAV
jgi:hypothetical protein